MMNLSPEVFVQTEDYFIELISRSLACGIGNNKYGLLPPSQIKESSSDIRIQEKITGQVEICLQKCNALTRGGYLIGFEPSPEEYIVKNCSLEKGRTGRNNIWNIILSFNPSLRIPTGIPDINEDPPRHPDVVPSISLSVLAENEINSSKLSPQQLIIGKILEEGEQYRIDTDYIPPSICMAAHPLLLSYYNQFVLLLDDLEKASKDIVAKVRNKDKPSGLALNIEGVCHELMRYISNIYFSFRNNGMYWNPSETLNCFAGLAHLYYVCLHFISVKEREEMLNYFCEWEEITPGSFEGFISKILELQYDHNNISLMMEPVHGFLSMLTQLWTKLSQLEFIGQHKDNLIVSDKRLNKDNMSKSKWTVL